MNEANNTFLTSGTSTINGYSGTSISTGLNSTYLTDYTFNSNNMKTRQVKAAVFTVERNDKGEVISSKFVKELWVEIKNGASLDLAVAKELKGDFDPETTVVREIHSFSF